MIREALIRHPRPHRIIWCGLGMKLTDYPWCSVTAPIIMVLFIFPEKLVPVVILNALAGKPLPIYGDGSNIRDWLYVEDHADALLLVCHAGGAWAQLQYWG